MTHELDLVLTLAGGLSAALCLGIVAQRFKLSPIVGYLFAGVAVGPFTPGFVANTGIANQLAEIGIILLMFGVGLKFHVQELLSVRRVAVPGALLGIAVATALGYQVARMFGWPALGGMVFGLTIAVSSTVVLLRVLADADALHTQTGHIAVGWLVVEDLFTVLVLVVLPLFGRGAAPLGGGSLALSAGLALLKVGVLVGLTLMLGRKVVPSLLGYISKTRSRELFTLTVLVIALGIAVGSAKVFGVSMALGAFLAGMTVGQTHFGERAASEALPMRDAFAVLFFVSIGMQLDPSMVGRNATLAIATLAVVLLGKPIAAFVLVRLLGYPVRIAAFVASSLAQIGEFSFVVAAMGKKLGILPERATQVLVMTAIVSITCNPILVRWVRKLAARVPMALAGDAHEPVPEASASAAGFSAIVVGYGPVGQTVARLLRESDVEPTIIELNHETVAALKSKGQRAVYGDASQREILEAAGVRTATSLIFAASGSPAEAVTRVAKELNPKLSILARSAYVREVAATKGAGADFVVAAEAEVALAMSEHLLTSLGASRDQLDRARERVREDLAAPPGASV
jgi:CPA2 family monovalent cation:H+ antiporter-2